MDALNLQYPESQSTHLVEVKHGVPVPDPFRWLEEIDSPRTQRWIADQNRLTFAFLEKIPDRDAIKERITQLWDYEKFGVPIVRAGRYFFTVKDGLQNQSVLYWMDSLVGEPRILLDPNPLSEDGTIALMDFVPSEDGRLLAFALSSAGSDWQLWRVRDVDTGQDLDDRLDWVKFSTASWDKGSRGFYYSRYDEPKNEETYKGANFYHKLYYHRIGTDQSADELVYERPDHKEWGFSGQVTEDGRYLVITVWKGTHRENAVLYADLSEEDNQVEELLVDFDADYTFVGNVDQVFFFLTDLDAPASRVIAIDLSRPERSKWSEVVPESRDTLQSVSLIAGQFMATYLQDAHSRVETIDLNGTRTSEVELPGIGTVEGLIGRQADSEAFFSYTDFTTPTTIFRYDFDNGRSSIFRQPTLAFDPTDYVTKQIFYHSLDGTKVPMFISHKKGLMPNGSIPSYLYGYGGFNIALTPRFSVGNLVWMELGGVYAQANLRGGSEYGKAWHEAGMKLNKQNVFDDFIAAAQWLIESGYTSTAKLAIGGRSNGGLLVGACLTQRPDLFAACLAHVGVLDMLRFHEFTIGWAWTSDYGSPTDPQEFEALLAYSPYHNLKPGTAYPATLIATGDHDDRVFPAHSFKFAAALQQAQAGPKPTLLRVETRAGHGLGKPTSKEIEEVADGLAFMVAELGVGG